jgi:pyruvate-formate lyase-activating enzyme
LWRGAFITALFGNITVELCGSALFAESERSDTNDLLGILEIGMNKLRLVMFEECNRSCEGCCNNDWDLSGLDIVGGYAGYDLVMLTGGEPMLKPKLIVGTVEKIRATSNALVYLYTAKSKRAMDLIAMLHILDGVTLTLHEPYDVAPFIELNDLIVKMGIEKSFRLNVFKGVDITGVNTELWDVKSEIEWIKDCPLPDGETIERLWN